MTQGWTHSGALRANGKSLEYACFGPDPSQAPTIVMLHEGLGCVALWRDFPQKLSEATGFGVFVFSRAGYGQSDPVDLPRPLDYMTLEAESVLPDVLNGIGFRRGILLGHSDGATIAAIYAGTASDHRVRGAVLMAPHFFTEKMGLEEIKKARTAFETTQLRNRLAKYHRDPDNAFCGWNDAWLHRDFEHWNVADVIDYIRVPILAIQGRDDQYGTLAQLDVLDERAYAPVETLILDDCKHAPFLDRETEVLAAISDYCVRLERMEAALPLVR